MENNYYKVGDKQLIDIMGYAFGEDAVFNFDILNAVKYLFRCKKKHETPVDDLKKAKTYIEHAISTIEDKYEYERYLNELKEKSQILDNINNNGISGNCK